MSILENKKSTICHARSLTGADWPKRLSIDWPFLTTSKGKLWGNIRQIDMTGCWSRNWRSTKVKRTKNIKNWNCYFPALLTKILTAFMLFFFKIRFGLEKWLIFGRKLAWKNGEHFHCECVIDFEGEAIKPPQLLSHIVKECQYMWEKLAPVLHMRNSTLGFIISCK